MTHRNTSRGGYRLGKKNLEGVDQRRWYVSIRWDGFICLETSSVHASYPCCYIGGDQAWDSSVEVPFQTVIKYDNYTYRVDYTPFAFREQSETFVFL